MEEEEGKDANALAPGRAPNGVPATKTAVAEGLFDAPAGGSRAGSPASEAAAAATAATGASSTGGRDGRVPDDAAVAAAAAVPGGDVESTPADREATIAADASAGVFDAGVDARSVHSIPDVSAPPTPPPQAEGTAAPVPKRSLKIIPPQDHDGVGGVPPQPPTPASDAASVAVASPPPPSPLPPSPALTGAGVGQLRDKRPTSPTTVSRPIGPGSPGDGAAAARGGGAAHNGGGGAAAPHSAPAPGPPGYGVPGGGYGAYKFVHP